MSFQVLPPGALTANVKNGVQRIENVVYILTPLIELCGNSAKMTLYGVCLEIIEENCHLQVS
jgi:hypothetical protein